MTRAIARFDQRRLVEYLGPSSAVEQLVVLDSTGSTNDDARRLARDGAPTGTVVIADAQVAGRGRLGRFWHSAPGLGLYISVLLRTSSSAELVTRWTLGASLAACQACRSVSVRGCEIEWPNDLVHDHRKLAGTLIELRSSGQRVHEVIVGTGFNVNQTAGDFPQELRDRATSIRVASGAPVEREQLAAEYVIRLTAVVERLERDAWSEVRDAWTDRAPAARGARVRVVADNGEGFVGTTRGVDDLGALKVERSDGRIALVRLGDAVEILVGE